MEAITILFVRFATALPNLAELDAELASFPTGVFLHPVPGGTLLTSEPITALEALNAARISRVCGTEDGQPALYSKSIAQHA